MALYLLACKERVVHVELLIFVLTPSRVELDSGERGRGAFNKKSKGFVSVVRRQKQREKNSVQGWLEGG